AAVDVTEAAEAAPAIVRTRRRVTPVGVCCSGVVIDAPRLSARGSSIGRGVGAVASNRFLDPTERDGAGQHPGRGVSAAPATCTTRTVSHRTALRGQAGPDRSVQPRTASV